MNTSEVATRLGTTARKLRVFLRSDASTFTAVGSGARYDFTEADVRTLARRFAVWSGAEAAPTVRVDPAPTHRDTMTDQDAAVWAEEGPIVMADIRDPAVRRAVRDIARIQEHRLEMMLYAAGLHISQMADRRRVAA